MNTGFYPKLALDGIRKNRRLYIPYLLTGTVMVMMSYIIFFLASSEMLIHMKGGGSLRIMLPLGSIIIALFSLIFMFYSNSFLLRKRSREFGLYNILGMDKRNLGRIMLWENLMSGGISIVSGLFFGIALSKLAELIMYNIIQENINYTFRIDLASAFKTTLLFCGIFLLLLFNSLIKVRRSSPLELLRSENAGEKPPKANWIVAVFGIILLVWAYYISVTIKKPMSAIVLFVLAVIMVIIATYLLFISGSVTLCRLLQKRKSYYYKPNHFVSVSSMAFRMKRNGAGLASICILITMILVMFTSTLSLYIGANDALDFQYPNDIYMRLSLPDLNAYTTENFDSMRNGVDSIVSDKEVAFEYSGVELAGCFTDSGIIADTSSVVHFNLDTYDNVGYVQLISVDDYNALTGSSESVSDRECLIHCYNTEYLSDTFTIEGCQALSIKGIVTNMPISTYTAIQIVPTITLIVKDVKAVAAPLDNVLNSYGYPILEVFWTYAFDLDATPDEELEIYNTLQNSTHDILIPNEDGSHSYFLICREEQYYIFFGTYAGLFFIGIFLSIVFVFAAVLIIYYKQISEGYEDQKRFEIMQKVGMTKADIRRSVNSQVLTVFFSPLIMAGLHLAFAFPIILKLLQMFNLTNLSLMLIVTAASFALFALVYALVYKITSNAYYAIVSGAGER